MLHGWRLVRETYAASAFTGHGAARAGGRWNSKGTRVVYASASRALAILETLVHINPPVHSIPYRLIGMTFPEKVVHELAPEEIPADWRLEPPSPSTKRAGDEWVRSERSAILRVPSAIVPGESNFLLNPLHRDFRLVSIGEPEVFDFDPRLAQ